jgi:hypothetical protein
MTREESISLGHTILLLLLLLLLLLFEVLTSQLSAGKHSPILGFNNQQE